MMPFYWFVLFISLGLWQQPNTAPFKISISTDKSTVVSGADVLVDVSLTNTSNRDVEEGVMYKAGIELDSTLRFEVRDDRGKLVTKRAYPHEELRPGKVVFRTIRSGETLTQSQPVSALYDMRKPGRYTIQVCRRNPDYDIKSGIVTVTVTAGDKDAARKSGKVHGALREEPVSGPVGTHQLYAHSFHSFVQWSRRPGWQGRHVCVAVRISDS